MVVGTQVSTVNRKGSKSFLESRLRDHVLNIVSALLSLPIRPLYKTGLRRSLMTVSGVKGPLTDP